MQGLAVSQINQINQAELAGGCPFSDTLGRAYAFCGFQSRTVSFLQVGMTSSVSYALVTSISDL